MINFSGGFPAASRACVTIAAAFAVACGGAAHASRDREEGRLWVLAPHPDDEVLMAGELLRASVARGRPVSVVVMTNGDLSCARNGHARQLETIDALALLGVREEDVHFLGYPDGWLDALGPLPLDPLPRTEPDGTCGTGDHTYASRGAGARDLHALLTGSSGAYVASGPEDDLAALLTLERPTEIVTAHGIDAHPDHAMTYVYLRRALERAALASPGMAPPRILRSIVHQGACWPNGAGEAPCPNVRATFATPFPSLAPPLDAYVPTLRIASADRGAAKLTAIARYVSQLGTPVAEESWLSAFARTEEPFYPEILVVDPMHAGRVVREPVAPTDLSPFGHIEVLADASGASLARDGSVLRHLPVPHGEDPHTQHHYEVFVDPRPSEGPIAEVSVRRDGAFWLLAVIRIR